MRVTERKNTDRLYSAGIILFALAAGAVLTKHVIFSGMPFPRLFPTCIIRSTTGYYCPGCGGTRSLSALLSGDIFVSAVDYPLIPFAVGVYLWYMISHTVDRITHGKTSVGMKLHNGWILLAIGIVLVHWIAVNLIQIITGITPFL